MALTLAPPDIPRDTQGSVLPNGLTVLVHEDDRFPLAAVRLLVRAGSAHEQPGQAGISHLLEHMVFKGTSRRKLGQIAEEIESVGGELNAGTGFDATMYIIDVPSTHWTLALDVLEDIIFHPDVQPSELEAEREVILSELEQGEVSVITATLTDADGPVPGIKGSFSFQSNQTSARLMPVDVSTNAQGQLSANYQAGVRDGVDIVEVRIAPSLAATVNITVGTPTATITISPNPLPEATRSTGLYIQRAQWFSHASWRYVAQQWGGVWKWWKHGGWNL